MIMKKYNGLGLFIFLFCLIGFTNPLQALSVEEKKEIADHTKPVFFTPNLNIWQKAPDFLPPGAQMMVLEGDPTQAGFYILRLKLPENYELPAHWTSNDEKITVITGKLLLGIGDKLDVLDKRNKLLPAGSLARIPAKIHHYATTQEETIIQLHGQGPWDVMYVEKEPDPITP